MSSAVAPFEHAEQFFHGHPGRFIGKFTIFKILVLNNEQIQHSRTVDLGPISTLIYELKPELKDKDTRRNGMIILRFLERHLVSIILRIVSNLLVRPLDHKTLQKPYHTKKVCIWAAEFHTGRIQMVHHLIFKKQHNLAACSILCGG